MTGIDVRFEDIRSLIAHGEPGVALENLCDNLHEFDFPVTRKHYEIIEQLGRHYQIAPAQWTFLKPLVA